MSRKITGALIIPAGLVLAAFALLPKGGTRSVDLQPVLKAAERSPAENPTLKFHPTENTRYAYSFTREVLIHGMKTETGTEPRIEYSGKFFVDVVHSAANGIDVLLSDDVAGQAAVSLRMRLSTSGNVLDVRSSETRTDQDRQSLAILKDLAANWDFPVTSDTVGPYEARFEASGTKKIKLAYKSGATQHPEITSSLHRLSWDDHLGMPASVQGNESTRMGVGTSAITSDSSYQMQLTEYGPTTVASTFDSLGKSGISDSLSLVAASEAPNSAASWDSLLAELPSLEQMTDREKLKLFHKIVAALKLNDGSVADLVSLLNAEGAIASGAQSALFKTVVGALASAGSPEAQAALVKIYQDPECPVSGKGVILTAMTMSPASATGATQDFLSEESKTQANSDLAHGAAYALGSSLSNGSDPVRVGQAIQSIHDNWAQQSKSGNISEERALLDVMGNSGKSEFLSDVKSALQQDTLRAKAVYALRYMKTPDAVGLLAQSLADSNGAIREAAVSAVQVAPWNEAFRAPLTSCATGNSDAHLQASCQSILASAK